MTPAQLRAFAAIARTGSVGGAARSLEVTDAAVSGHVAALRRELGDELFRRTASGLAFTPGGLRLATRAVEMLGLQDRTRQEVQAAAQGRRTLRIASSALFAEYAAPGLIELFSSRAADLQVELSIEPPRRFASLLASQVVDVTIGPPSATTPPGVAVTPFLRYQVMIVAAPGHPLAGRKVATPELAVQDWFLGPSAAQSEGVTRYVLDTLQVPEARQRIFQSHAAALEEVRRGTGLALALGFAVRADLEAGRLARIASAASWVDATWNASTLNAERVAAPAAELIRFITTPRATQAMLSGSGAGVHRFRPSVHITLWR
ncbi:MAG: LysR family transcriptional regulator [Nitriliruptor sp.]|uniref:LysR family transcriptional regulator n=1 Tax=Nitriliruptor sp. TaxID=2448056 RepID=UPI0034A09165